jgi:CheY-like chemotaxis protein
MDLKQSYRRALGARIDALAGALALLPGEPAEARASIRRIAHSLRGSGATYGFPEVSQAAAAVEESGAAELAAHAGELLALLRGLAEEAGAQRVLVVDDDPEMQLLLGHLLDGPGVEVTAATSAAEARARLEAERFDLVVLDLLLPDADGRQVLLAIRGDRTNAATPVFMLSAKTNPRTRAECAALGANGFFEKPFEPESLATALHDELRRARSAAAADR